MTRSPSLAPAPRAAELLADTFLTALRARDFDLLEACFDPDVHFRALVPPGVREGASAGEAVGWLRRWFGEAEPFTPLASTIDRIGDRLHLAYRFHLRRGTEWSVIEQQVYCTIQGERIAEMSLLCSGFLPAPRA